MFKGWNAKLYVGTTEIGYCESATVDISSNTEGYFQLGSPLAQEIVAGNLDITGTIDRAWVDGKLMALIDAAPTGSLDEFNLKISLDDTAPKILLVTGCKPETTSFDIPQDGFVTNSFDFIGKTFTITPIS